MLRFVFSSVMLVVMVSAAGAVWVLQDLPYAVVLEPSVEPVVVLEAADGTELVRSGPARDPPVAREDIPQHLVDAILAIEDRRFYDHPGIDLLGILRAAIRNLRASGIVEGGSTITQQLVKLRLGDDERTFTRKIREALLAVWLENRLDKGEILTQYLNTAYFGAGATGISAAARVYFGKPVSELALEESAMLAGLVTAPSRLNPLRNPEAAAERAAVVLEAMVDAKRLDAARAETAKARPAMLRENRLAEASPTWFSDWVQAGEAADLARSFGDGRTAIRVRTTLNPRLQSLAEEVVSAALDSLGAAHGDTQAGLVVMRPDGAVLAMVGGRSYEDSAFNRAVQAMRQPGSTFKLFVYLAALRNGYSPDHRIEDAPIEIDGWSPGNFGGRYHGVVTLSEAFARSLNAATVRLAEDVGIDEVVEAARLLGLDAPLRAHPSLALGTSEVSLLDLTGAYASVLAGTAPVEPTGIAGYGGLDQQRLLAPGPSAKPRQSLARHQRPLIGLLRRVVEEGTGRAAALDGFAAGKTGTSENFRDAWFIGFTEDLVAGVWLGNDDGEPMDEMTGGKLPAAIWRSFMTEAARILDGEPRPAIRSGEELVASIATDTPGDPDETPLFGSSSGEVPGAGDEAPFPAPGSGAVRIIGPGYVEQDRFGQASPFPQSPTVFNEQEFALQPPPDVQSFAALAPDPGPLPAAGPSIQCDVDACSRAYRSFRRADCTYQPYRGPRKLCLKGDGAQITDGFGSEIETFEQTPFSRAVTIDMFNQALPGAALQCNYDACSRAYRSFRASDCSFKPYRGGRRLCEK